MPHFLRLVPALLLAAAAFALPPYTSQPLPLDRFRPLDELLPQADGQRTGGGEPGPAYWQQQADYVIRATLDEEGRAVDGTLELTYTNRSPQALPFLWLQLDGNVFAAGSLARRTNRAPPLDGIDPDRYAEILQPTDLGSLTLLEVAAADGAPLRHRILDTLARVDLPAPLAPGARTTLRLRWRYLIPPVEVDGRGGWETLADGEPLFAVAQWYPRVAAYTALDGWHLLPFLGQGEFTQEFGDFRVEIDVPAGMVVAATGELRNADAVLSRAQRGRLDEARTAGAPVAVVTLEEARAVAPREGRTVWRFEADGVRDFAWAASRRFVWDAQGVPVEGRTVLAMSFYPPDAGALWPELSTRALVHAVRELSAWLVPYPWPVILSVNGGEGGMEYPMLAFNGPRTSDGTDEEMRREIVLIVLHEAAHNWFPMLVNSDERRWSWMDEGLVTFLQERLEQTWWDEPGAGGESLLDLGDVMRQPGHEPLMSSADVIEQHGSNAYTRPAAALWVLRHAILGPERFDEAFAAYTRRWAGRRPHPADFFRTLEQVSGEDLDWFFRGWFYTVDRVNLQLQSVRRAEPEIADINVKDDEPPVRRGPTLRESAPGPIPFLYLVEVRNAGGIPGPILLGVTRNDGGFERHDFPALIWRGGDKSVTVAVTVPGGASRFVLDPENVTGDTDRNDHTLDPPYEVTRFPLTVPVDEPEAEPAP